MFHITNKHKRFCGNMYFKQCEHEPLEDSEARRKKWFTVGSRPYEELRKIILHKDLWKDMSLDQGVQRTLLEVRIYSNKVTAQYIINVSRFQIYCFLIGLSRIVFKIFTQAISF